jgi:hypothetical protein
MNKKPNTSFAASSVIPARVINIAVDTAYLYSQPDGQQNEQGGIYMMDNNVDGGSTNQGGLELSSQLTAGFGVAFNVFPVDAAGSQNDSVEIVNLAFSSGTNIFGNWGYPQKQTGSPYQWLGTAMVQGNCVYQLKIGVSIGNAPTKYYWWDPFLNCTA